MASIFVQIPSYRDFELPKTIQALISASSGRHNISIGVHQCLLFENEVVIPENTHDHVSINCEVSIAPTNLGEMMSRNIANQFFDDEDYYLQIDSHSRVAEHWDDVLIENIRVYREMGIAKPLISAYPHEYSYDENRLEVRNPIEQPLTAPYRSHMIALSDEHKNFSKFLIPQQRSVACHLLCGYTSSVSNGFIFTTGDFARIKPNPKIAFWGSEIQTAARAFTHGFDLVMPLQASVWHLYNAGRKFKDVRRHAPWGDFPQDWAKFDNASKQENVRILEKAIVGEYELGEVRSLAEYEQFAGLDFAKRVITQANYEIYCRA